MTAPSGERRDVPAYVALVRIAAVIAMSAAIASGIFLLLAGTDYLVWGLVSIALALPCYAVMRLVERAAEPRGTPPTSP